MEEAKTLLLSLQFDTDEGLKRAADLRAAIDADKDSLAALNKEIKSNGPVTKEMLVQREKLEQSIRQNTEARSKELKAVNDHIKATRNSIDENGKYNGSINNLRGNLAFLTAKWNDLSKAERENAQVGGVMQKEIKRLSDELKELEGSVGDNRRSVGGYLDAIRQAPGAMGKMKAGINGISAAMSANPFGLILQLLPQITALFNSSGKGADFLAEAMGIVNAVVQEGLKRLVALGGAAVKLMTGDFKGAFADGKAALSDFSGSIDRAVKAGGALARNMDELEEKERVFGLSSAETERQIEKLLIQARNRTTSEAERQKLLEKAEKLELRRNQQEIALAQRRVDLVKEENKIKQEDTDAQDERLKEAQKRVIELERQSENIREKIQVRKDQLADAALEREKKRQEQRVKQFEENKKRLQEELKLFQDIAQKTLEINEKQLGFERDQQAERDKMLDDDTKRLDKQLKDSLDRSNAEVAKAKKEAQDKITEKEKEYKALLDFTSAASGLAAALAEENSSFAEFQKAVTLFEIGLASAEAITKGIAASQDMPFPGNLIAMGTTIATISANLLQAKQLISGGGAPKPPASRFAEGGLLVGPSHAEGGITGTGRFANVEVEGGEAVITKKATALFGPLLSAINVAGGGKPLAPTRFAAMGGLIGPGMSAAPAGQLFDYDKLANKMVAAIERMPAPVVGISDIKAASAKQDNRKRRVTLGA